MEIEDIKTIIVAIIGSGVLNTAINQWCSYVQRRNDDKSGMRAGIRLVLKDRLRFLCGHYITQGWIYSDELEDIIAMHECYHTELEGNGYLDTLMQRVKQLPIKGVGK